MATGVHHIPNGLPAVIPQLVVPDGHALADFARKAFGAELAHAMPNPDGKGMMHGMLQVGGAPIFVSDVSSFAKPTSGNIMVYVPDVDSAVARAVEAGATIVVPVGDMFWGDRWGMIADPWGNIWQLATHKEDVGHEEMSARMKSASKPQ